MKSEKMKEKTKIAVLCGIFLFILHGYIHCLGDSFGCSD